MLKRQVKHKPYTMVEILLVLAISLIVVGLGSASISAITGKRGLNGAASMVSSQVNLARSVAVSQNRHVALLTPEPFSGNTENDTKLLPFFCNRMRLCFVQPVPGKPTEFTFAGWIEGYDWMELPKRTCAHPVYQYDYASLVTDRLSYGVDKIEEIPVFASGNNIKRCTGIVFAPTGRLASYNDVMIQAYTAIPNFDKGEPDMRDLGINSSTTIQGSTNDGSLTNTKLPHRRWCISVNKFTGRTKVSYAQPEEK